MEEEEENSGTTPESSNKVPGESIVKSIEKIDTQKAMIVVFMITACICGLIGFYFGMEYITNECNTQYQEFFNNHYCVEGQGQFGNTMEYSFPSFDINTTGEQNVK